MKSIINTTTNTNSDDETTPIYTTTPTAQPTSPPSSTTMLQEHRWAITTTTTNTETYNSTVVIHTRYLVEHVRQTVTVYQVIVYVGQVNENNAQTVKANLTAQNGRCTD